MSRAKPADDVMLLIETLEAHDAPHTYEFDPLGLRAAMRVMMVQLRDNRTRVSGVLIASNTVASMPVRVYRPAGIARDRPLPTIYFMHGGGWVCGDLDTHDALCRFLSRDGLVVVVSVDFPLAPEHPFPQGLDANVAGLREVHHRLAEFGGAGLVVAGDSAGGNWAAVLAQECRDLDLQAQILIDPWLEPFRTGGSRDEYATGGLVDERTVQYFLDHYLSAGGDPEDPRLTVSLGEVAGTAPALVVTTGHDGMLDECIDYAEQLAEAGVPVKTVQYADQMHGFATLDHLAPSTRAAVADLVVQVRALLHD